MKTRHALIMSAGLLFASCGQQHQAESVVKEFLEENLKDASTLSITEYGEIDSTRYLNDSIINELRKSVNNALYKGDIKFSQPDAKSKLIILRVKYNVNEKEYHDTYYLNNEMTEVVTLKNN